MLQGVCSRGHLPTHPGNGPGIAAAAFSPRPLTRAPVRRYLAAMIRHAFVYRFFSYYAAVATGRVGERMRS